MLGPLGSLRDLETPECAGFGFNSQHVLDPLVRRPQTKFDEGLHIIEQPGEATEYTINLWPTSNLFKAGHRIGLEVSSSNFPRFDRNLNTGHELGEDAEMRPAVQTIFHDAAHPSRVTLLIVPR